MSPPLSPEMMEALINVDRHVAAAVSGSCGSGSPRTAAVDARWPDPARKNNAGGSQLVAVPLSRR